MKIIVGKTIKGLALGRKLGFPTLNIPYEGKLKGVFAGKVFLENEWHLAAINIGGRPTVDSEIALCEAFLIDWQGQVEQGNEIKINILSKIRKIKKFADLEELKQQISKDVEMIKSCYNSQDK